MNHGVGGTTNVMRGRHAKQVVRSVLHAVSTSQCVFHHPVWKNDTKRIGVEVLMMRLEIYNIYIYIYCQRHDQKDTCDSEDLVLFLESDERWVNPLFGKHQLSPVLLTTPRRR
jgi:hypothetical protein